jgi:hypothetical protein
MVSECTYIITYPHIFVKLYTYLLLPPKGVKDGFQKKPTFARGFGLLALTSRYIYFRFAVLTDQYLTLQTCVYISNVDQVFIFFIHINLKKNPLAYICKGVGG